MKRNALTAGSEVNPCLSPSFPSPSPAPPPRQPNPLFASAGQEASGAGLPPPKTRDIEGGRAVPVEVQRRRPAPPPRSNSTPPSPCSPPLLPPAFRRGIFGGSCAVKLFKNTDVQPPARCFSGDACAADAAEARASPVRLPRPCLVRASAQAALFDYLHSTRGMEFTLAEHMSKNSLVFVAGLLGNVDTRGAVDVRCSVSRFLQYDPINEFEPFFESIGLRPSELGKLLPSDMIYLNDAVDLLENYKVLCDYGVQRTKIGKVYKEAKEVFGYGLGVLFSKLQQYEQLGLSKSTIARLVVCCPKLLIGEANLEFLQVFDKLKAFGIMLVLYRGGLSDKSMHNWSRTLRMLEFLEMMGSNNKALLVRLIKENPRFVFGESGNKLYLVSLLCKFGIQIDSMLQLFVQCPWVLNVDFPKNLRKSVKFLAHIGMEAFDITRVVSSCPEILGASSCQRVAVVLSAMNMSAKRLCDIIKDDPMQFGNLVSKKKFAAVNKIDSFYLGEKAEWIMAHRGQLDGRSSQAPGLMRHGAFSATSLSGRQLLESSHASILEILEDKLAVLTAEAEKLIRENQRLASSHVVLRQDIVETEKEMQMIRSHLGDVQVETDMHLRDLVERMRLMEADIQGGDAVKKELHQVHMEAKRLITERQMLTSEIETVTKELQKFPVDNSNLPELVAELDGLRKEHHSLRSAFEYEKNTNIKQVEQMRTMEMNLITMTKEADKLRADVANATNRAHAAHVTAPQPGTAQAAAASASTNPYASAYANQPSAYQQGTLQAAAYQQGTPQAAAYQQGTAQAVAYQQGTPQTAAYQQGTPHAGAYQQGTPQAAAYQQGNPQAGAYAYPMAYDANAYQMHANAYAGYSGYPVAGYAQPGYPGTYAAPQHPTTSGAATDGTNAYGAAAASTGYPAGPVQASSGAANTALAPPAPYPTTYDPTRGAQR